MVLTKDYLRYLNMNSYLYLSAGFMYINIDKWIKEDIVNKVFSFILKNSNVKLPEQDALNCILEGSEDVYWLGDKWNHFFNCQEKAMGQDWFIEKDTIFVHYVGRNKFWSPFSDDETKKVFKYYNAKTPWAKLPIIMLIGDCRYYKYYKELARLHFVRRKYLKFIQYFIKYIQQKYFIKS